MDKQIKTHNALVIAKVKHSDYRKTYSGLLWWAERQGYKQGWAKWKFGEIFGKWPAPVTPVVPVAPNQDLREYLGIMKNRWKAKKKREERKSVMQITVNATEKVQKSPQEGTAGQVSGASFI